MSGCAEGREELASYALGLLDEPENLLFEAHLAECSGCARELEDILHTVEDLALVARDDGAMAELTAMVEPHPRFVPRESMPEHQPGAARPRVLRRRENAPPSGSPERQAALPAGEMRPRKRPKGSPWRGVRPRTRVDDSPPRRRMPAIVAAAAVLLVSAGLALVLIGPGSKDQNAARAAESPIASASTSPGQRYQNTDPRSGAHVDLVVSGGTFGSRLLVTISKVTGPRRCRLVTVDSTGATEVVSSWLVPASGYGTAANPAPLQLQATSALTVHQIARVEVQHVDPDGRLTVLVAVPIG
ncbi:MAG: zf-HC2 domain-containing protein [Micromonosporaceae bacterium]|nr:zf-HC2 domain-containing protein [Micromonosporaceae bacterium]